MLKGIRSEVRRGFVLEFRGETVEFSHFCPLEVSILALVDTNQLVFLRLLIPDTGKRTLQRPVLQV